MGRGSRQTYWALVESYRTPRGSRQRVVAYLGKLQRSQANGWDQLSQRVSGRMPEPPGLFDETSGDQDSAKVDLKSLRLQRVRDFGDVYLGHHLWRMPLGFPARIYLRKSLQNQSSGLRQRNRLDREALRLT